jgi:hypothetical protein
MMLCAIRIQGSVWTREVTGKRVMAEKAAACGDGKILNPATLRCVDADGPTGLRITQQQPAAHAAAASAPLHKCPAGSIHNDATGRCVKVTTPLGQELLAALQKAKCGPDQIINPQTLRCVSRTGKIGQAILQHGA